MNYDCCINNETCSDFNGDGNIVDAIGDGVCIAGAPYPYSFACKEVWNDTDRNGVWDEGENGFNFNCDGGDCGIWDEDLGECVMPEGEILNRRSEFYSKINDEK